MQMAVCESDKEESSSLMGDNESDQQNFHTGYPWEYVEAIKSSRGSNHRSKQRQAHDLHLLQANHPPDVRMDSLKPHLTFNKRPNRYWHSSTHMCT